MIVRLIDYCRERGIDLGERNFTLEYESNIPQRLGLGGSSAIITASLRALLQYYGIDIALPQQANLVLETETRELGVPAGLQDRVVQAYQGLVYMDFSRHLMESRGFGEYERLDPACSPKYMWPTGRLSAKVPRSSMATFGSGGGATIPEVLEAMMLWASYAEQGRDCLLNGDYRRLNELVDANFDLRSSLFQIDPGNLDMVVAARKAGASANFAGSGGAIVGTYTDENMFQRLTAHLKLLGVAAIRPKIAL